MLTLLAYVEAERLPYSIINARPMNAALVKEICHGLLFCIR
jgi:hypothetical protein